MLVTVGWYALNGGRRDHLAATKLLQYTMWRVRQHEGVEHKRHLVNQYTTSYNTIRNINA
jgi:hypothetical protein